MWLPLITHGQQSITNILEDKWLHSRTMQITNMAILIYDLEEGHTKDQLNKWLYASN